MLLSIELETTLRTESAKGLREAMEAWGRNSTEDALWDASKEELLNIARRPVYALSIEEIVALYEAIDSGDLPLEEVAPLIRMQEEQMQAAINGDLPALDDLSIWGVRLVAYVAGVFVPAVTHLGDYSLGADAVYKLVSRIAGKPFREVVGAGTAGEIPERFTKGMTLTEAAITYRYLLLAPLFASLTAFYPVG